MTQRSKATVYIYLFTARAFRKQNLASCVLPRSPNFLLELCHVSAWRSCTATLFSTSQLSYHTLRFPSDCAKSKLET